MLEQITASWGATIYERNTNPDRRLQNTGKDPILELSLQQHSSAKYNAFRSRFLLKFSNIPIYQGSGEYYIKLYAVNNYDNDISGNFFIEAAQINKPWDSGTGLKNDSPITKNGVNWIYRDSNQLLQWDNEGADYLTANSASLQFTTLDQQDKDIQLNITDIVNQWNTNNNYGLLIKFSDEIEQSSQSAAMKYFSPSSHTIYKPVLQYFYDDSIYETGSLVVVNDFYDQNSYIAIPYSMRAEYYKQEKVKFYFTVKPLYQTKSFTTQSTFSSISDYCLPSSSYYSVVDLYTNEEIIPFNETYNKLSCDENGNYFICNMNNLERNHYYKIVLKAYDNNNNVNFFNNGIHFKVK